LNHLYQINKTFFLFSGYTNQEVQRTCPRCELDIIPSKGIYNLRVDDVRLGEDEHFECQVSPGKGAINSVPLRAAVKINIQGENFKLFCIIPVKIIRKLKCLNTK